MLHRVLLIRQVTKLKKLLGKEGKWNSPVNGTASCEETKRGNLKVMKSSEGYVSRKNLHRIACKAVNEQLS